MNTVDIDIGGTFTDCFVHFRGQVIAEKVETTHYDLAVCFLNAIKKVVERVGCPLAEFLGSVDTIRYSTTVAMNKLIERSGPPLGLITTAGFEDTIFIGKGSSQWADGSTVREQRNIARIRKPVPLIPRQRVVGVIERVDSMGRIVVPLDLDDARRKLQHLVDQGVQGFVVSLLWSFANPSHERALKQLIREEYPEAYLGSMPVLLSSEVKPRANEYERTMTAIVDAYLHRSMKDELSTINAELIDAGYSGPLMMVHNTGGMAEVFKTAAIETYNGGPVAGLMGSRYVGGLYGWKNVIAADMGGTSFDLGLVVDGSTRTYDYRPVIDHWAVHATMLETKSIGAGGGSIAWINELLGKRLEVGPQSAGSMPGPVAYDQGGTEPTVTDADVVLGFMNPDTFHGGRKRLNRRRARNAIRDRIADPLGIEVEEAAALIRRIVDAKMGDTIYKETALRGYDPRDFVLFAFGGGGALHACGFADRLGVKRIVTFPYSPVFCAFGASTMDIMHVYEKSRYLPIIARRTLAFFEDYDLFNGVVRELREKAWHDVAGEGFSPDQIDFSLELDMKYGGQLNVKRVASPRMFLQSAEDVQALYAQFEHEYSEAYSPLSVYRESGVEVENFILKATVPQPRVDLPRFRLVREDPEKAFTGQRDVLWEWGQGVEKTAIYSWDLLEPGNRIGGPAIIEAAHTTIAVPRGKIYYVDEYRHGIIEDLGQEVGKKDSTDRVVAVAHTL